MRDTTLRYTDILSLGILSLCILSLCVLCSATTAFAQSAADRRAQIDELMEKSNPKADDWQTEIDHSHAKHQMKDLGKALAKHLEKGADLSQGVTPFFAADAKLHRLRPKVLDIAHEANPGVRRTSVPDASRPTQPPIIALKELIAPLNKPRNLRFAFKITSVHPGETEGYYDTSVLYQVYANVNDGGSSPSGIQQNATWLVSWRPGHDPDHPLIQSIRLQRFEEITTAGALFTDCTASVIPPDETWKAQMALGGEYWYGRVDAVGELNFLGHEGVAVGDVNNDDLDDVYVAAGNGLPNRLYIQQPDGSTRDTAYDAGMPWLDPTKGVLLVDIDNDDDQDLLLAMGPTIVYCQNDGKGVFTPFRKLRAGTDAAFYSLSAADYDNDGDLDIYGCRYVKQQYGLSIPMPFHDANNGPPNHLLRNDGAAGFKDVTREVGLHVNNSRFSLAASWSDFDNDGDLDLYVANDFGRNNLYRNDGGTFVDIAPEAGVEDQAAGMGVAWSDIDLDGDLDLHVANMFSSAGQRIAYQTRFKASAGEGIRKELQHHTLGNALFRNNDDGTFEDIGEVAGIRMGRWSWGAKTIDINNDAYDDIIAPNGFLTNARKDDL